MLVHITQEQLEPSVYLINFTGGWINHYSLPFRLLPEKHHISSSVPLLVPGAVPSGYRG